MVSLAQTVLMACSAHRLEQRRQAGGARGGARLVNGTRARAPELVKQNAVWIDGEHDEEQGEGKHEGGGVEEHGADGGEDRGDAAAFRAWRRRRRAAAAAADVVERGRRQRRRGAALQAGAAADGRWAGAQVP